MEEPSILDYLKDKLAFWRKKPATPPNEGMTTQGSVQESISTIEKPVIEPTGVIEKKPAGGLFRCYTEIEHLALEDHPRPCAGATGTIPAGYCQP